MNKVPSPKKTKPKSVRRGQRRRRRSKRQKHIGIGFAHSYTYIAVMKAMWKLCTDCRMFGWISPNDISTESDQNLLHLHSLRIKQVAFYIFRVLLGCLFSFFFFIYGKTVPSFNGKNINIVLRFTQYGCVVSEAICTNLLSYGWFCVRACVCVYECCFQ